MNRGWEADGFYKCVFTHEVISTLFQKWKNQKFVNFKLKLLVVACSSFVCVVFSNCLFESSDQFIFQFISFLIFTPQVVGGGFPPVLVQWTAFSWGVSNGRALGICQCGRIGV